MSDKPEILGIGAEARWVDGHTGRYAVTRDGSVVSFASGTATELSPSNREGYESVVLYNEDGGKSFRAVHRLVYEAFVRPLGEDEDIHHKNGDRQDNRLANLAPIEHREHSRHHNRAQGPRWVLLKCPQCNDTFSRRYSQTREGKSRAGLNFCSQSCSGKYYASGGQREGSTNYQICKYRVFEGR